MNHRPTTNVRPLPRLMARGAGVLLSLALARSVAANPEGMTVVNGSATAVSAGPQLNVTASHNTMLDWRSFNIRPGETTTFLQPSATSIVWNRILDQNPSQILGGLHANGYVVLVNQSGFYFGPKSVVSVAGMLATTAPIRPPDYAGGGSWQFNGAPPVASIINYGEIKAADGGAIYLIAEKVENHGVLMAPDGTLGLYAGKDVLVSERPDGRGVSAQVRLPSGTVDNFGKLIADAGTIALHAQVVNQNGMIQANSVRERGGVIELVATDSVNLGADSVLNAKGDSSGNSAGGNIRIKSDGTYSDEAGASVSVAGGANGGAGGTVAISAPQMSAIHSSLEGQGSDGANGGRLVIDPTDIVLNTSGTGSAGSGTVGASDGSGTLTLNINSAFGGFSQISLQATRDITLAANTQWDLNASTGVSSPGSALTLEAGRNILFGDSARIHGGAGWSVNLAAGADFTAPLHVSGAAGGVYLNGGPAVNNVRPSLSGAIETQDGNITLRAAKEIVIGTGFIRTMGGGDIELTTLTGSVDAGSKKDGFEYFTTGYRIASAGLGGIATGNGGDVTIHAGGDILSLLPMTGAYGSAPGDVNLTSDHGVIVGNFLVRNGTGRVLAGLDVGSAATPVTLSLIKGDWDVTAVRDIYLNEVNNPNGTFNKNKTRLTGDLTKPKRAFEFDYDADAGVKLTAGNSVQLLGTSLVRTSDNRDLAPVYAPNLEITAGAGGVMLGNDVVLHPSPLGSLKITTTGGGTLRSTDGGFFQLVMSDSGDPGYKTFAAGHASTPLHLANPSEAVRLDISGDINNVFLRSPKMAAIAVGGSTLNFSLDAQNLTGTDVTTVQVGRDIFSRSDRTFELLNGGANDSALDLLSIFNPAVAVLPDLIPRLTYDAATGKFGIQGRMTPAERDYLLNPAVKVLDGQGNQGTDNLGQPLFARANFTTDTAAIQRLYERSQDIPSSALAYLGMQVGGAGRFAVSARNLDLGVTKGIRSVGPTVNTALAKYAAAGADISLGLAGNLDMTSSQIVSFSGGKINLVASGNVNVGSQEQFTNDDVPKGIYTVSGGDVTVQADANINVNGSRIAAFDGGNVLVTSVNGDVNAGDGGVGAITVTRITVDPLTGVATTKAFLVGISGIAATLFPDSGRTLGNLTVNAGRDILANFGGVRQASFGTAVGGNAAAQLELNAGRDIKAGQSGIVGQNVKLDAGRSIEGIVVATRNLKIDAVQNVNVTAAAGGGASVKAGGDVGGKIASGGAVDVSASSISGSLISQNVSTSGDAKNATVGPQATANTKTEKAVDDTATTMASKKSDKDDDEELKKKRTAAAPTLVKTVGRVTVILPGK